MSKYWSKKALEVDPYICGEQLDDKNYIRLNTNENPYPPSPKVIEAIKNVDRENLRFYPSHDCDELREAIAQYYKVNKNQVFVGNGSDEVLAFSFAAFFNPGEEVVFPDISYNFYPVYASLFDINYRKIEVNEDFSIPVEEFLKPNGGVILPNPNAPTGMFLDVEYIKKILDSNSEHVVIIDEAYIDFGGASVINLVKDYPNLLVVQTFSKSRSLAGMRVGFAIGNEELIEAFGRIKDSFNSYTVDRVASQAALAAIKDEAYFRASVKKVVNTREWVSRELKELGFNVLPSMTNFLFISYKDIPAGELYEKLKEMGILVRYYDQKRIEKYLRVTIGSDSEMKFFIEKIKDIVK